MLIYTKLSENFHNKNVRDASRDIYIKSYIRSGAGWDMDGMM